MDETTGEGVKLAVTKESASEASGSCRVLTRLEARFRRFRWDATRSAKLRQGATSSFVSALSKYGRAPADGWDAEGLLQKGYGFEGPKP